MQDQRAYTRGSHFSGRASVSRDGTNWTAAHVSDLSSSGLKLFSAAEYRVGDMLWFELLIQGFLSEFKVNALGEVRRKARSSRGFSYGVHFKNLSQEKKIQIDESVHFDRPVAGEHYGTD